MTLTQFFQFLGALGGGTLLIAAVRLIFVAGKLVEGQERMEQKLDDVCDAQMALQQQFTDLAGRVRVLEFVYNTADRRHYARRMEDQLRASDNDGAA